MELLNPSLIVGETSRDFREKRKILKLKLKF